MKLLWNTLKALARDLAYVWGVAALLITMGTLTLAFRLLGAGERLSMWLALWVVVGVLWIILAREVRDKVNRRR